MHILGYHLRVGDAILTRIKRSIAAGEPLTPAQLSAPGDWIDRTARVSNLVVDARLDERRAQLERAQAKLVAVAIGRAMDAADLTLEQRLPVLDVFRSELRVEVAMGVVTELES
jgi:hypothetical protein